MLWPSMTISMKLASTARPVSSIIICGDCWPARRVSDWTPSVSPSCIRCCQENEDALHYRWVCKTKTDAGDPAIDSAQDLASSCPTFSLRDMLPLGRITPSDRCLPSEEISPFLLFGFPPCNQWPAGEYCEEASGGEHIEYLPLRRCGVGMACLDPRDLVLNTVLASAVINSPGRVQ